MGRPTKWQHWLGRLLYLALALSIPTTIVMGYLNIRVAGVLDSFALIFVIWGVIDLIRGAGVELYPREVWERPTEGPHPPLFPPPGTTLWRGLFLLALGLINGFLYRLEPWLLDGSR